MSTENKSHLPSAHSKFDFRFEVGFLYDIFDLEFVHGGSFYLEIKSDKNRRKIIKKDHFLKHRNKLYVEDDLIL